MKVGDDVVVSDTFPSPARRRWTTRAVTMPGSRGVIKRLSSDGCAIVKMDHLKCPVKIHLSFLEPALGGEKPTEGASINLQPNTSMCSVLTWLA